MARLWARAFAALGGKCGGECHDAGVEDLPATLARRLVTESSEELVDVQAIRQFSPLEVGAVGAVFSASGSDWDLGRGRCEGEMILFAPPAP
jgi:hypothetical protein